MLAGASFAAGGAASGVALNVADFGGTGDGVADDSAAIQSALDAAGRNGGGVVLLPRPKVQYRITRGLRLPSYVILQGESPVHYPYNAGNKGACALVADFPDTRSWMIEPATEEGGRPFGFDTLVGKALPQGVTYNCGVKNLLLTSKGKVPFGGIRMHACPGSVVEGVSINRVGCGLLVNYSFGGSYKLMVNALYYGVAAWDDANANIFAVHCTHAPPWPKVVPPEYRLSFMAQMQEHLATTLHLTSNDHAARPYGLLCGSIASTSIGNVFDAVVEQFPGGIFLYNAYATDIRQCYLEGSRDTMAYGVTASRSRFSIQGLHAYLSGTGALFDFGIDVLGKIFASGILNAGTFGKPPRDDGSSLLLLEGVDPLLPGAPTQRGIRYVGREPVWVPLKLGPGWRADAGEVPAVRFDPFSHRIEFKGTLAGSGNGLCFVLPASCRPPGPRRYAVPGGQITIASDGSARIAATDAAVSLDGICFSRW